jgi:hypothetical protein
MFGADYFICIKCEGMILSYETIKQCCLCDVTFCESCSDANMIPISNECCGECREADDLSDVDASDCICHPSIIELRENGCCTDTDCDGAPHYICENCPTTQDPYQVTDGDLCEFLLPQTKYKTINDARKACRKFKKDIVDKAFDDAT